VSLFRAIQRFPLEDYLDHRGAEHTTGVERQIPCPVCGKDKLVVNVAKRVWHCWYCEDSTGTGKGNLFTLIQVLEGLNRKQAAQRLLEGFHDHISIESIQDDKKALAESERNVVPISPPSNWRCGAVDYTGILPYCLGRGISYSDIVEFGLLWCDGGQYANRLIFPVWEGGHLVYWQARAMWEKSEQRTGKYIKMLNPPRFPGAAGSTDVLFNLEVAATYPRVVITEGPIDAIHVGRDAVCTFGKKISPTQIEKLAIRGVRAVDLMWDGPGPTEPRGAWPEMFKAAQSLSLIFDTRLVFIPKGDPGDYTREQLHLIRRDNVREYARFSKLQEV